MGLSLQQSKRRIKSITSTKKITKAMELVSTSKLKRVKELNLKITPYRKEVENIMASIITNIDDKDNLYFQDNKADKKLCIIVTSSLGLCGGYNSNMYKYLMTKTNSQECDLITIGSKGYYYLKNRNYNILKAYEELPTFNVKEKLSTILTRMIMKAFEDGKYKSVELYYTKFVNSLLFEPVVVELLPLRKTLGTAYRFKKQLLLEPTPMEVLNELIPFYLTTILKTYIFESIMAEQASRRNAMENATDNAQELQEKLLLEYNKARQAAITQEITEISSSAEALS